MALKLVLGDPLERIGSGVVFQQVMIKLEYSMLAECSFYIKWLSVLVNIWSWFCIPLVGVHFLKKRVS